MQETSSKVLIVLAVITMISGWGTALITNWNKVVGKQIPTQRSNTFNGYEYKADSCTKIDGAIGSVTLKVGIYNENGKSWETLAIGSPPSNEQLVSEKQLSYVEDSTSDWRTKKIGASWSCI